MLVQKIRCCVGIKIPRDAESHHEVISHDCASAASSKGSRLMRCGDPPLKRWISSLWPTRILTLHPCIAIATSSLL
ncbi:hypothetical protein TIFTF001_012911 [Ficus carica]|uniref:Uncharacterized protein n=1 Tax=Ficus carica TaxID=3494 RepID=A0AA88DI59_FICCA|nr:hypothetical protein TIFTF001_012911 [Ficus carica]